jgi:hypothetical protein
MGHFQQNPLSLSVPDEHFKAWASNGEAVAAASATAATRRAPRNRRVCAAPPAGGASIAPARPPSTAVHRASAA